MSNLETMIKERIWPNKTEGSIDLTVVNEKGEARNETVSGYWETIKAEIEFLEISNTVYL